MKITEFEEPGIFLLGIELLDSAGHTLFETLERQLKPLYGENWFSKSLVRNPEDRELAPRDLSVLLIQIEIRNNNNFRLALRTEYNEGKMHEKPYFDLIRDLRITRNEWFHRIISPITSDELLDLSKTIVGIFPPDKQISRKAMKLINLFNSENFSSTDLLKISEYIGGYVLKLEELQEVRERENFIQEMMIEDYATEQIEIMEEILRNEMASELHPSNSKEPSIGLPYSGSLLPYKYTLKLDGTIIDRRGGTELKDVIGDEANSVSGGLLKNHPAGGRLRISSGGAIVGYQNEEWIVIGHVSNEQWFRI